jgi:hypothetical protein
MKEFKKPDLSAPRYRAKAHNLMTNDFFKNFRAKFPKYEKVSDKELKKIIKVFNETVYQTVIESREGVQLPQEVGWLFVGTCDQSKKKNIDYNKSKKYGVTVTNKNWETDGKLCKIFFTSYNLKHKIKNREFWGFTACRNFKRSVSKAYAENWNIYVQVDPKKRIQVVERRLAFKEVRDRSLMLQLKTYNEFEDL